MEWMRDPGFLIGTTIGLIGLVFAVYQIRTAHQRKEPTWAIDNTYLIRGFRAWIGDLKVIFRNQAVETLSVSRVVLWNAGGETIRQQDLTEQFPLRIEAIGKTKLLDVTLIASNRESNQLSVSPNEEGKQAPISFVHLDKGNGGVFQVIHTGDSARSIQVTGELIGVNRLRQREIKSFTPERRRSRITLSLILLSVVILMTVLTFFDLTWFLAAPSPEHEVPWWIAQVPSLLYLGLICYLLWPIYRARLPRGLEAFHDDPFRLQEASQEDSKRSKLLRKLSWPLSG